MCEKISMSANPHNLSRRERQIMDIIYSRGEATALDVHANMPVPPSYSAVRSTLRILEEKGVLKHREDGRRYVFLPVEPHRQASRSALKRVVETFFAGSLASAVASLVDESDKKLTPEELKRIESIIKNAKNK